MPVPTISIVTEHKSSLPPASARTTQEQEHWRSALPGEALTRRAVTAITAAIVVMTFAFAWAT